MLLTVLGGLAEFERSLIRARTSEVSVLYRLLRLTTVVSVSHVDLKIDRAMKTPRSLAGETEVSLTRAMAETSRGHRDEQGHDAPPPPAVAYLPVVY